MVRCDQILSFPVSTMPVIATFAYLSSKGQVPGGVIPYVILVLCLLGVVLLHSAGNVISDWSDYRSGDGPECLVALRAAAAAALPGEK